MPITEDIKPVCDIDAEQATLGSVMIDPSCMAAVRQIVGASDFYRPTHQDLWHVLTEMIDCKEPVDIVTLTNRLRDKGKLEKIGGTEYLMALVETVPTSANAEHYAKIVKRCANVRRHAIIETEYRAKLAEPGADPRALSAWLREQLDALSRDDTLGLVHVNTVLSAHYTLLERRQRQDGERYWDVGIPVLTAEFGRFGGEAQLILLKGYRGSGKTHWLVHCASKCIEAGRTAVVYSLEMSKQQLIDRFLAWRHDVDSKEFRRVNLEWEMVAAATEELWDAPLYLEDTTGITVPDMLSQCQALREAGADIGFVGIDFAEQIGASRRQDTRELELTAIAGQLRSMSNELNTTVMLLSQVNDQGGERHSRGLGNLADLLLSWQRPDEHDATQIRLVAEKNRFGDGFVIELYLDPRTSRIWETDRRWGEIS